MFLTAILTNFTIQDGLSFDDINTLTDKVKQKQEVPLNMMKYLVQGIPKKE